MMWSPRKLGRVLAAAAVCAAVLVAAATAADGVQPPERVTLIGDSVPTAILWNEEPLSIVEQGYDLDAEIAVCRRLIDVSCPYEGARPATLVDLVAQLEPRLGRTVVVVAGYNEPEETFADAVEQSVSALTAAGVTRILWASLSERRADYTRMNAVLAAAALRYPQLAIVPWAEASHAHDDWFQTDGVHLTLAGAIGMAQMIHQALLGAASPAGDAQDGSQPLQITQRALPPGRVGHRYSVAIAAVGGAAPYCWSSTQLPRALHFSATGRLTGVPRVAGQIAVRLQVVDHAGARQAKSYAIRVAP